MAHIRLMPTFSEKARSKGVCSITGNPQAHVNPTDPTTPLEPIVDLDTYIDYEGNLEIAMSTAREIAGVIGWLPAGRAEELQDRIIELEGKVGDLYAELDQKTAALSAVAEELHNAARAAAQAKERAWAQGYERGCSDRDATPELG